MYRVTFTERSYVIEPPEAGDDRWKYQGSTGLDVSIDGIYRSEMSGWNVQAVSESEAVYGIDEIPVNETAYLVLVEYITGDTFGSHETWCIAAVKARHQQAEKIAQRCCGQNHTQAAYRPWDGYFEHLKSASVVPHLVR